MRKAAERKAPELVLGIPERGNLSRRQQANFNQQPGRGMPMQYGRTNPLRERVAPDSAAAGSPRRQSCG